MTTAGRKKQATRGSIPIVVLDDGETYGTLKGARIMVVPEGYGHDIEHFLRQHPTGGTDLEMLAKSNAIIDREDPRMEAWRRLQNVVDMAFNEETHLIGILEPAELKRWEDGVMPADELLAILARAIMEIEP